MKNQLYGVFSDTKGWHIVEIYSGKSKYIGIAGAKRSNNYDKAVREATIRNAKNGIKGYIFIAEELSPLSSIRKIQLEKYENRRLSIDENSTVYTGRF